MKHIKLACIITSLVFTGSLVPASLVFYYFELKFDTVQILILFLDALAIGLLTAIRVGLDNKKWMLKLSRLVKRIIFSPVYIGILIITLLSLGDPFVLNKKIICFLTIEFFVIFVIVSLIKDKSESKKAKEYMDQINAYKKNLIE